MAELNDEMTAEWMKQSRRYQQENYNLLGDRTWDFIEKEDILKQKIGFALFGLPICVGSTTNLDYNEEQNETINSVKNHIVTLLKNNESDITFIPVYIACIYVYLYLKNKNEVSVDVLFRVTKSYKTEHQFVDRNCRTYSGWNDYLENNKLPKCLMCYPSKGIYSIENGSVKIDFGKSPACKLVKELLNGLDITSKIVSIGAAGLTIASLAVPIATPVVWGATAAYITSSAYDIGRSANMLIDKKEHKHKSINGVGILNSLLIVVTKFLNGTLNKSDIKYFTQACAFFLNAIVSYELANILIEDIATNNISNLFYSAQNTRFQVVKFVAQFDVNTYYEIKQMVLGPLSKIMPNVSAKLNEFAELTERFFQLVISLKNGTISLDKFLMEMLSILESFWRVFSKPLRECIEDLRKMFNLSDWTKYSTKFGYKPFQNSNPEEARQFCMIIRKTIKHCGLSDDIVEYREDMLSLIEKFNSICPNDIRQKTSQFLAKSRFICDYFEKEFDRSKETIGYNFDSCKHNFKENCSVDMSNPDDLQPRYIFKNVLSGINVAAALAKYMSKSDSIFTTQISEHNNSIFETDSINICAYSGPVGNEVLTEDYYWYEACRRTDLNLNRNNSVLMSRQGIVFIRPVSFENCEIKFIIFYNSYENDYVMGLMTVVKNINTDTK